jgi:hypothetical protein
MRIGVVVENIGYGELAECEGHPRNIRLFADLLGAVRQILLLAPEAKRVAQEQARRVVMGKIETSLLSFKIRKSRKAMGYVDQNPGKARD